MLTLLSQAEERIHAVENELQKVNIRYYLYDHPNITNIGGEGLGAKGRFWKGHHHEVEYDDQIMKDLQRSSLRTMDPEQADLYIPLINLSRILTSKRQDFSPLRYVVEHEYFRRNEGYNYVIICTCYHLFRSDTYGNYKSLKDIYPSLYNVTVVQSFDGSATYNEFHHSEGTDWGEFNVYRNFEPVVRKSVSLGLGTSNNERVLVQASREKFENSSNFIFYHTTTSGSWNNSTIFRHAPIKNVDNETLPKSSIGWGIGGEEWEREFKDSKFCLMIRGDSPHSHALVRSIRVGCIPVIISDTLPIYSPMLKSSIQMSDYAIILDEQVFINNPQETLLKLNDISEEMIDVKLMHLAFAQRVLFSDHPQSLFIPAFLREAQMATEVRLV